MNEQKETVGSALVEAVGCVLTVVVIFIIFGGLPLILSGLAVSEYKKNSEAQAKLSYVCTGTVIKVESGESPDYSKWKSDKSKGVRLYLGDEKVTNITFKDGRVKEFSGIPDFEIPLDRPIEITYDGNRVIKKIEPFWPKNPFAKE